MEPIISPWLFYFASLADNICGLLLAIGVISAIVSALYFIVLLICVNDESLSTEKAKNISQ